MGKLTRLALIKKLVELDQVYFTTKAGVEMERDGLLPSMVYQAIINAVAINKTLRSRDPETGTLEHLYVIVSSTNSGMLIYTKGKIRKRENEVTFYVLISSKRFID